MALQTRRTVPVHRRLYVNAISKQIAAGERSTPNCRLVSLCAGWVACQLPVRLSVFTIYLLHRVAFERRTLRLNITYSIINTYERTILFSVYSLKRPNVMSRNLVKFSHRPDNVMFSVSRSLCSRLLHFYRPTLCVSAVFALARCLSVRLSVTFVYCIQTQ